MRPMVDSVFSAFGGHCIAANGALAREAGPSFSTFSFNEGKFHLYFSSIANPRSIDCSIERLFREAG